MRMHAGAVIAMVLLLAGCAGGEATPVTPDSQARMAAADGLSARIAVAREICAAAGHDARSPEFSRCVGRHFSAEAARLRERARYYSDRLARRHGLCLDRARFTVHRCLDI